MKKDSWKRREKKLYLDFHPCDICSFGFDAELRMELLYL